MTFLFGFFYNINKRRWIFFAAAYIDQPRLFEILLFRRHKNIRTVGDLWSCTLLYTYKCINRGLRATEAKSTLWLSAENFQKPITTLIGPSGNRRFPISLSLSLSLSLPPPFLLVVRSFAFTYDSLSAPSSFFTVHSVNQESRFAARSLANKHVRPHTRTDTVAAVQYILPAMNSTRNAIPSAFVESII